MFGRSVAIAGDTIVTTAWFEGSAATGVDGNQADNSAASSGAAYSFVLDTDADGVRNSIDNCPSDGNSDQVNTDGDAQGDVCDADDDGDAVADGSDNCQVVANQDQLNSDGDALGDACDSDDDGDAVADGSDNCQLVANQDQLNTDGDAFGDACDPDDDGDAVADGSDNCQLVANQDQLNTDADGQGNACDAHDDRAPTPDPDPTPTPDTSKPVISGLGLPSKFRAGKRATIKLTLDEAAEVRFTVKRLKRGRRVGGRCKPPTRSNNRAKKCDRQLEGAFKRTAKPGQNKFKWNGELRGKQLAAGEYLLIATPRDAAGNKGKPRKAAFEIL
jgi:hypothetical protein